MDALLSAPDQSTDQGRRDHALLLFLYNTGVRADEAAHVKIVDLLLAHSPRDHSLVSLHHAILSDKVYAAPAYNLSDRALSPGLTQAAIPVG